MISFFCEGFDIITLDESGFNNQIFGKNGWDLKGSGKIQIPVEYKSVNHTLLLAISLKYGVIAYQIKRKGFTT